MDGEIHGMLMAVATLVARVDAGPTRLAPPVSARVSPPVPACVNAPRPSCFR
jgi:hypothetical protein